MAQDDIYRQNVKGQVMDQVSHMPLPGATIVVMDSDPLKGTTADKQGYFVLEAVKTGRVSLEVSHVGYKPVVLSGVLVETGKEPYLTVKLEEIYVEAAGVEIKASHDKHRTANNLATVSARSFSVEETNRFAGTLGDPSRMVATYAGVATVDDSRNDIIIRGNSPLGVSWRLEGVDIPNPNHFAGVGTTGGPVSMLNNNLLDNSDFFTSAFPAEYGNALSGVFDLRMRSGNKDRHEFTGQVGFNGVELGAEGPLNREKRSSFLVSYRYSVLQLAAHLGIDPGAGQAIPQYQDAAFKVDFPGLKRGRTTLFGIGGISNIQLYDSKKDDSGFSYGLQGTDTDYGSKTGVLGVKNVLFIDRNTRMTNIISLSGQQNIMHIDSLKTGDKDEKYPFLRSNAEEMRGTFQSEMTKKFDSRNTVSLGFTYKWFSINQVDSVWRHGNQSFESYLKIGDRTSLSQMWVQAQHKLTNELVINAGLHSMVFLLNNESVLEPRAGVEYEPSPHHRFSLGYGTHNMIQPFQVYFLRTRDASGKQVMSNKDLKMTRSGQLVAAYNTTAFKHMRIMTEAYYQWLSNVPVSEKQPGFSMLNTGAFFNIPLYDSLVNKGTGRNYGVEITLERFFRDNYYWLTTVSLFQSVYEDMEGNQSNTAFNNEYVINALGGYQWDVGRHNAITVDVRGVFAGGRYYTPIDKEASEKHNQLRYQWDKAFSEKNDPYFRLDLKVGFKMQSEKFSQTWGLDLRNVTDQKNVFARHWDPINQTVKKDYQQGFFPMLLWRIQF